MNCRTSRTAVAGFTGPTIQGDGKPLPGNGAGVQTDRAAREARATSLLGRGSVEQETSEMTSGPGYRNLISALRRARAVTGASTLSPFGKRKTEPMPAVEARARPHFDA